MANAAVLISTAKLDPHADAVITLLEEAGASVFRVNTEDLLVDYEVTGLRLDNTHLSGLIRDREGRQITLHNDVRAGYYRKPERVEAPVHLADSGLKDFVSSEGEACIEAIYSFPGLNWVNNPIAIRKSRSKFLQLHVAAQFGFRVPRTLITQSAAEAKQFFLENDKEIICKPLATPTVQVETQNHQIFTHKIREQEFLSNLDTVSYCPVLLQEHIKKKFEIRATIIGSHVFACRIESQQREETRIDWRTANPFELPHSAYDLPDDVAAALINATNYFGLEFGAADLIVTPDGEYVFLENNPNGQWYWIELITGQPMAKAMTELLLSK